MSSDHSHRKPRHQEEKEKDHSNSSARPYGNNSTLDDVPAPTPTNNTDNNPFMSMFGDFRSELDEHHDRRERVIKVSRDVTALSKKMIFTMHRTRKLYSVLPQFIAQDLAQRTLQIEALFKSILPDISADTNTLSAYRYQRNISDAIQEYLEAASFRHYITTGTLISIVQAQTALPAGILLTVVDYFGGILDLIGELMRLGITIIATTAPALDNNPTQTPRILSDLREFRRFFDSFDLDSGPLGKELDKKMATMRTSVDKVERAVYGMFVRGRERPPGWVPDVADIGGWGGGVGWEADAIR